jgi:hypothetical protein
MGFLILLHSSNIHLFVIKTLHVMEQRGNEAGFEEKRNTGTLKHDYREKCSRKKHD